MDLSWFGEEGAAAPAAEAAGSEQTAVAGAPDMSGQAQQANVSPRVAAEMKRQMQAHPERYQKPQQADAPAAVQTDPEKAAEAELQSRWEAAKKGEFAKLYGQDVQNAIKERFKNQKQDTEELTGYRNLEPMLKVLRERAGVESNEDLMAQVMDDDSLYEDAANEAGMTVEAYKKYLKFQQEHDEHVRAAEEQQHREAIGQHYMKLAQQAEELKAKFPDFDLDKELQNEEFLKLTSPAVNTSVEAAYYAIHYNELAPQMMAYGMQRAKNQMAQTIQVNGARPREGGLQSQNAAANMTMNFKAMDRRDRMRIYEAIHAGRHK